MLRLLALAPALIEAFIYGRGLARELAYAGDAAGRGFAQLGVLAFGAALVLFVLPALLFLLRADGARPSLVVSAIGSLPILYHQFG